jgi:alpha-D-ribose 1-methylphosphonate 5-phosphate C-P lyase
MIKANTAFKTGEMHIVAARSNAGKSSMHTFTIEADDVTTASSFAEAVTRSLGALKAKKTDQATIYDGRYRMIRQYQIVNNRPRLVFCSY